MDNRAATPKFVGPASRATSQKRSNLVNLVVAKPQELSGRRLAYQIPDSSRVKSLSSAGGVAAPGITLASCRRGASKTKSRGSNHETNHQGTFSPICHRRPERLRRRPGQDRKTGNDARQQIRAASNIPAGDNAYLVTSQIQPGTYSISRIFGVSQKFPIMGSVDFAVDAPFEITPNSVTYLGRLATVNKEKTNKNDQSTGAVLPIIDQAVSGFGSGTLHVVLKDNYEEDVKLFKKEFVYVQNMDVIRRPLQKMMLERTTGSSAKSTAVRLETNVAEKEQPTASLTSSATK